MKTKKVAIVGASGYSGEELVKLLLNHPHAELVAVTSRQNAGQTLAQVFPKFASHPKSKMLRFVDPNAELLAKQADVEGRPDLTMIVYHPATPADAERVRQLLVGQLA